MSVYLLNECHTIDDIRTEIFKASYHDPLVSQCLNLADSQGLSGEDKYVLLAYQSLKDRALLINQMIEKAKTEVQQPIIIVGR